VVLGKGIKFDLAKVPPQKVIKELIAEIKMRYPNVYRVLVKERNEFMAEKLANIIRQYPEENVIAVVGAGHEKEMAGLVKNYIKTKQAK